MALIIEAPCNEGVFLPSKLSDTMAVGLPVLAISPAVGVLHDLHESGYVKYFSDVTSVESIVEGFESVVSDYVATRLENPSVPSDFRSEHIGMMYDEIIDAIS